MILSGSSWRKGLSSVRFERISRAVRATPVADENAAKTFNFKERLVNVKLKDIDAYASEHMSTNWITERTKILQYTT